MKTTLRETGFLVCDDWLPPEPLARLRAHLQSYRYFSVYKDGRRGPIGTIAELAAPLAARELRLLGGQFVVRRVVPGEEEKQTLYPSGTPLDQVLESVDPERSESGPYLGLPKLDWHRLGAGPRLYPAGGGLPEHDDADSVGTFVLYVHERWEEAWGGELSIGGTTVHPEPNRCVFVKGGTPHTVAAVENSAGPNLRTSVIGYSRRLAAFS